MADKAAWPPAPPKDENEGERAARLEAEREAKRISDEIDRALEQERQELRKRRPQTKILLLGQSESGKSTMVKNFQLYFCPTTFYAEAEAWRAVIHLNLVRHVNHILELLSTSDSPPGKQIPNKDYRVLQMRLSPLKQVELILTRALSAEASNSSSTSPTAEKSTWRPDRVTEVSIRGGSGWKALMRKRRGSIARLPTIPDEVDDARRILDACKDDVVALWKAQEPGNLEDGSADHGRYFLNNAARVSDIKYIPTADDILRARLRTLGVEEYRMAMETAAEKGTEWVFYDVGGARSQRAAWASYFDDVNAMIFLCPISGFNQQLAEDVFVNRLADSMELWSTVCKSKLLANATFILLLNKADLLAAKLKAGLKFEDFAPSYRGRPNKAEYVAEYLREQMMATHRFSSPKKRQLHVHVTCAIDTNLMGVVLTSVRDVILIDTLQHTTLL
ncbi:G-alpha-domain-containing protein [Dichomitus squalens LYAD-421 SS1]|uniref:G-alpha-domain-containing protein n=1 Tax=Dichomitus squalens TaxID=114155 RepID=A0A4Q9QBK9_9APHY|nr:G-alpha-domain-containing protein [Dichomitus squalens LYAD-421 SS1]EJF65114.1 G-alpha-domain-containing protein [Dichomitus squalens LYAD-421 SS1]TBU64546.1 G-alpha-domain-containing protein [Dichomitus squalens]